MSAGNGQGARSGPGSAASGGGLTALAGAAAGIWRLQIPLPFSPRHVHCYLCEGEAGWDIVDAGADLPATAAAWTAAFAALGIGPGRVRAIYVTHYHTDHFGFAARLQARTGAPVRMHAAELAAAGRVGEGVFAFRRAMAALYREHGMPGALVAEIMAHLGPPRQPGEVPAVLQPLQDGDSVPLGNELYRVLWTPGHSDGQFCLYGQRSRVLLSADHLLPDISSNVSLAPEGRPDPLGDFLSSLDRVARLDAALVLPGHGEPIAGVRERAVELQAHHRQRLAAVAEAVPGEQTAYAVSRRLFPWATSREHQRGALAETLAHLERLVGEGLLVRRPASPVTYTPAR